MIGAIVQARTESTRFPNKVFAEIGGVPLLQAVVDRCRAARMVDVVIVATTESLSDEPLVGACADWGVEVVRGSEDDVLSRFAHAADVYQLDTVVRVTADDPFKDPDVIDYAVSLLLGLDLSYGMVLPNSTVYDYVSNTIRPSYPEGLDIEVFTVDALRRADREARRPSEREHVTPYLWNHPDGFRTFNFALSVDRSHLRWTIDYRADLDAQNALLAATGRSIQDVRMSDLLAAVDADPNLSSKNMSILRNEGYLNSLRREKSK